MNLFVIKNMHHVSGKKFNSNIKDDYQEVRNKTVMISLPKLLGKCCIATIHGEI